MSDTSKDRTRVVIRALNHGHTLPCARRDCLVCFAIQHIEAQAAWMEGAYGQR
jgi:hypothetical protein